MVFRAPRAKSPQRLREAESHRGHRCHARRGGSLWGAEAQLRLGGRLKADLDLLIAATALDLGATLVTDDGDLLKGDIPGLRVENWIR
jgi:predicted nucleic acid-binding protein